VISRRLVIALLAFLNFQNLLSNGWTFTNLSAINRGRNFRIIMVSHKEILHASRLIAEVKGTDEMTIDEIFGVMQQAGSNHPITDVRTEMRRCCKGSPKHHYTTYEYFEESETGEGVYRLIKK
jgi:hypothetical protein